MGNVRMEARQINYRGGETPMTVEEAIKNAGSTYVLPIAADDTLGGVKVGTGLSIDSETGVLSNSNPTPYELPIAGAATLGGVMVGDGLEIDAETGVLSASGGSVVYSTTEREVGEYFGKKLYEKSYILFENGVAQYTVTNNEYQIGMTGYDDAFVAGIVGVRSDAGDVYVDSGQSGAEVVVVFNKTDGSIYFTSGHAYTSFIAVVRYTKQSA